jgi:N-acetylmuramoyl-L-alanine amidase
MLDKSIHYPAKLTLLAFVFCETLLISAIAKPVSPYPNSYRDKKWVVVIDAGHGGKDPGCHGIKYKEKDVALAVSLKLGHLIEENDSNVKVIYTRSTDVFIPLNERAAIANRNHADFFICVHCNASPDKTKYGAATYVMGLYKSEGNLEVSKRENSSILYEKDYKQTYSGFDPNSDEANILFAMYQNAYLGQSLDLAAKIQKEYAGNAQRTDNGVKQAGFLVLWKTTMPSLLTEIGFLTDPQEEMYLGSQKGQAKTAACLFFALQQYIDEKEGLTFSPGDFKLPVVQPDSAPAQDVTAIPDTSERTIHMDTTPAPRPVISSPSTPPSKDASNIRASLQALHPDSTVDSTGKVLNDTTTTIYKVQIASSPKPLSTDTGSFKNAPDVEMYMDNARYKYTAGHFSSLDDAVKLENNLRREGFQDAFIVAFKGENRVPVVKGK